MTMTDAQVKTANKRLKPISATLKPDSASGQSWMIVSSDGYRHATGYSMGEAQAFAAGVLTLHLQRTFS